MGGVTKSRPIDPFIDVIYLFLNIRFGQKVFKFSVFGCHDLRFGCITWYFSPQLKFFYSISRIFLITFFCRTPIFPSFTPSPLKFFCPLKKFLTPKNFCTHPKKCFYPPHFCCPPSLSSIFGGLQKVGVLIPKIPPASAPLRGLIYYPIDNKFYCPSLLR